MYVTIPKLDIISNPQEILWPCLLTGLGTLIFSETNVGSTPITATTLQTVVLCSCSCMEQD